MYKENSIIVVLLILILSMQFIHAKNTSCYDEAPVKLVDSTVENFLNKLNNYKKPSLTQIRGLINQDVEPHANFNITARLVLGQKWNQITAQQKKEFVQNLKNMILNTYASAFTTYSGEKIEIRCPIKYNSKKNKVEIDSRVTHPQKQSFSLTYRLYKKGNEWIFYDIIIDNVSVVHSYRQTVIRLIEQNNNFDKVLEIMAKKGQSKG